MKIKRQRYPSGFLQDIEQITRRNSYFRKVVFTGEHSQLVIMSVPPGGEIGEHEWRHSDQILLVTAGQGKRIVNGHAETAKERDIIFIPAGTPHNLLNSGEHEMKLFIVYSPPEYLDGTIHQTQEQSAAATREVLEHAWEQ